MKKSYKVKLGVMVYHEVDVDVVANNAVEAMDVAVDGYDRNLLAPMKEVRTTPAAIISVSKKGA